MWIHSMAHTRFGKLKDVPYICWFVSCCPDNNECELDPCGHGRGHCVNSDGSYKCLCRQGYKHMVQHGRPKCIGESSWASSSWFQEAVRCFTVLSRVQIWTSALNRTSVASEDGASTCPDPTNANVTVDSGSSHTATPSVKVQTLRLLWYNVDFRL